MLTSQEETLVGGMEVMMEVPDMDTSMEHEDEDMVVEVSHGNEEPPSHGDMISPVHEPPTLPEKGWEEVIVLGGHVTVRNEVEMNMEKSGEYHENDSACISLVATVKPYDKYDCTVATNVQILGTGSDKDVHTVQYTECTVDLQEVDGGPVLQGLERTPSMVHGVHERFRDVRAMVKEWELVENCKEEWEVKEGRRRGGRRISKRMSELLGIFGDEEEQNNLSFLNVNPDDNVTISKFTARGLAGRDPADFTASFGTETRTNAKYELNDVVTEQKTLCGPTEGCDWLASLPSQLLTASRNPVRSKRKLVQESGETTKRRRAGSN